MSLPELIIRADGNAQIGLGHIYRTLALAGYLRNLFNIKFVVLNPDDFVAELIHRENYKLIALKEADFDKPQSLISIINSIAIVVLDGYNFSPEYQSHLKSNGRKLVVLDDLNNNIQIADAVINHGYTANRGDYKLAAGSKLYTGLKYLIVKPEIIEASFSQHKKAIESVIVCIGGTDPGNHSYFIGNELLNKTNKKIKIVTSVLHAQYGKLLQLAEMNSSRISLHTGLNANELIHLIQMSDLAILQPSNIALEAACLGIFIAVIQTAENQRYIKETLINSGCAIAVEKDNLIEKIEGISVHNINAQLDKQKSTFDKTSPGNIVAVFNNLLISYRKAAIDDAREIYSWNNDPITRQNSYNSEQILFENHINWYQQKINDENCCFLLFLYNNEKAGTVRIDVKDKECIIGITIAPEFRNRRLAAEFIRIASDFFFKNYETKEINAYVKFSNQVSINSFEKAGYRKIDVGFFFGAESIKLLKTDEQYQDR